MVYVDSCIHLRYSLADHRLSVRHVGFDGTFVQDMSHVSNQKCLEFGQFLISVHDFCQTALQQRDQAPPACSLGGSVGNHVGSIASPAHLETNLWF